MLSNTMHSYVHCQSLMPVSTVLFLTELHRHLIGCILIVAAAIVLFLYRSVIDIQLCHACMRTNNPRDLSISYQFHTLTLMFYRYPMSFYCTAHPNPGVLSISYQFLLYGVQHITSFNWHGYSSIHHKICMHFHGGQWRQTHLG